MNHIPNIDALAKEGMLFNRAFVNNSLCALKMAIENCTILQKELNQLNKVYNNPAYEKYKIL